MDLSAEEPVNGNSRTLLPAESELIVDIGCETPQINYEAYNGRPYKYFYAISSDVDMENPGTVRICLYDLDILET
jgi:carotenoid isomerooxygenase